MIRRYFRPGYSGDFRVLVKGDDVERSILEVVDPIPSEQAILRKVLQVARAKGWCDDLAGIALVGRTEIEMAAPVADVGEIVVGATSAGRGAITAIASERGNVTTVYTSRDGEAPPAPRDVIPFPGQEGALAADSSPKDVVTADRPSLGARRRPDCPDTRASEVLQAFSTPRQWETWMRHGWMEVYGRRSGHTYRLAHRRSDLAQRQGRVGFDCDDGLAVHAYNWLVPPAEEVLGIKLYLEHAEEWIRNPSGIDEEAASDVYPHPMGLGDQDGAGDREFLDGLVQGFAVWEPLTRRLLARRASTGRA